MNGVMLTKRHISFIEHLPMKVKESYSCEDVRHALEKNYEHPILTERLSSLRKSRVNLDKSIENPWYSEMKEFGISNTDIAIISYFLRFRKKKEKREMEKYMCSERGTGIADHCYTVIFPYSNRSSYIS